MKFQSIKFFKYIFYILTFLFISDLNNSISKALNTESFLSIIILLLTLILFVKSFQIKIKIPFLSQYYILFYIVFLLLGTLIFYLVENNSGSPFPRLRSLVPSAILVYTYSKWFLYYISQNKFNSIIKILNIALLVNCIAIIYSFQSGNIYISDEYSDAERSSGLIASVNQAGTIAAITEAFMLFAALRINISKSKRYMYLLFYFVALFAAIVTFSKAAMLKSLILMVVFIYFYLIKLHTKNKKIIVFQRKYILIPFLTMFLILSIGLGNKILSEFSEYQYSRLVDFTLFLQGNIDDEITTNRTSLAEHSLNLIKKDQYMGRGLNTFHRMEGKGIGPHNQFLLILGEVGFLGFLLYVTYYILIFYNIIKIKSPELKFLGISLILILVVTAASAHTMLFVKTYVIMFSFLNVLSQFKKNKQYYKLNLIKRKRSISI